MKYLISYLIIFLVSLSTKNEKLVGLWKSIEEDNVDYINLKPNGDYFKISSKETKKLRYFLNDKYIQVQESDGNFKEEPYYIDGDTLIFQSIINGEIIKKKYLRQKLVL